MPWTCKEATRPDTALFSAEVASWVSCIRVLQEPYFDAHKVVMFRLSIPKSEQFVMQLRLPKTWMDLPIDHDLFPQCYMQHGSSPTTLREWGARVENMVDSAYRQSQCTFSEDPQMSTKSLAKQYRGRCQPQQPRKVPRKLLLKQGRTRDFNPDVEVYHFATAAQVKQVRRLRNLVTKLQKCHNQWVPQHAMEPLMNEWNAILRAKGFGRHFAQWCQEQPELGPPSLGLPTLEYAHTLLQLVTHTCQSQLAEDAKCNRAKIKYDRYLDKIHAGHRKAFQAMRRDYTEPLSELSHGITEEALVVQENQYVRAYVANSTAFVKDAPVKIDQQVGRIVDIDDHSLLVTLPDGVDQLEGEVPIVQECNLFNTTHLFDAMTDYWQNYWMVPDPDRELPDSFRAFLSYLQQAPNFEVEVKNPTLWIQAIKAQKANSARGIDGISSAELKTLPDKAIEDLATILGNMSVFPDWFMLALTIPLPKKSGVIGAGQIRPITIFSQLYRTWSRVVSQQILSRFADLMPVSITGFLKHRGPMDASVQFAYFLEKATRTGDVFSGITLDLVKCFNTICRKAAGQVMLKLGLPETIVHTWAKSLDNMQRRWLVHGQVGPLVNTNNGCPEGDSMSIVAMIALAYLWLCNVEYTATGARATCYADNWGWAVDDAASHQPMLELTSEFTQSTRMIMDWSKTWTWATTKEVGLEVQQLVRDFHPYDEVSHVNSAMDLGCQHTYRGSPKLGQFADRLSKAKSQLTRMQQMPHDCQVKTHLVMGGAYPTAFYGVELVPLGSQQIQQMRPGVANAILGYNSSRNSTIAIACLPRLLDPQLFILARVLSTARRFLRSMTDHERNEFYQMVTEHSARHVDCNGPAGCFAYYLSMMGWSLDSMGQVWVTDTIGLPLLTTGKKVWRRWLDFAWQTDLIEQHTKRHILHGLIINTDATRAVLDKFSATQQQQLVNELSGAFQTAHQKAKWAHDADNTCSFCDAPDSRFHRVHECNAFAHIRLPYSDMLHAYLNADSLVHELPVVLRHRDHELLQMMTYQHVEAQLTNAVRENINAYIANGNIPQFYTDGSLLFPELPSARYGAYSLVWDLCTSDDTRRSEARGWKQTGLMPATLQVLTVARVQGNQTIYRAELSAVVILCEHVRQAVVWIDSQSVLDVIEVCHNTASISQLPDCEEMDLVIRMWTALRQGTYQFFKIRAHQDPALHLDLLDCYRSLGNAQADLAATTAAKTMYPAEAQVLHQRAMETRQEMTHLQQLFHLHLELHAARILQEQQDMGGESHGLEHTHVRDQLQILQQWTVVDPLPPVVCRVDWTRHSVLGPTLSGLFAAWARALIWPTEQAEIDQDPGVTFMEMAVSFSLFAGIYLPVKRDRTQGQTFLFLPATTEEAIAQDIRLNELGIMVSYLMHQFNQLCKPPIFPPYRHAGCKSLYRIGAKQQSKGIVKRPVMPHQDRVMKLLEDIARKAGSQLPQQQITLPVTAPVDQLRNELQDSWSVRQERVKRHVQGLRPL
eukprot:Skav201058  [mRNA]  locus=scaffold2848:5823:10331:- [translate_table: standard]